MPLQRRLPKRGFKSTTLKYNAEVTLASLEKLGATEVDMLTLKQAGLVKEMARVVKVINTGKITLAIKLTGIGGLHYRDLHHLHQLDRCKRRR